MYDYHDAYPELLQSIAANRIRDMLEKQRIREARRARVRALLRRLNLRRIP